ncbi:hypothetical protein G7046_g1930 [Stylonectria norvegica]|nr:hypothetical protein G7046_g1930 [Stylonectria norvegica]
MGIGEKSEPGRPSSAVGRGSVGVGEKWGEPRSDASGKGVNGVNNSDSRVGIGEIDDNGNNGVEADGDDDDDNGSISASTKSELPLSRGRCIALVVTVTGASFLNTLAGQSVVIILPSISRHLDVPDTRQQWIVSSYILTFGCFLLLWGRIADIYGKRLIFIIGSVWVTVVTAVNPFLPTEIAFDIFRGLHGLGAAANVPTAIGILGVTFPPGKAKNYAFSAYAGDGSLALKPSWPLSSPSPASTSSPLPPASAERQRKANAATVDWIGATLITVGLIALMFALTEGNVVGWSTPWVPALIVVSLLIVVAFGVWQWYLETRTTRQPLIKPSVFRNWRFSAVMVIMCLFFASFNNYLIYATYYFQDFQGLSPLQTMLRFIPTGVGGIFIAFIVAQLLGRIPTFFLLVCGNLSVSLASLLYAVPIPPTTSYFAWGLPAMLLSVLGADTAWPCLTLFVSQALPKEDQAVGGALINAVGMFGRAIGLAIATAVQTAIMAKARGVDVEVAGPLEVWDLSTLKGLRGASWVNFGFGIGALCVVLVTFRSMEIVGRAAPQPERSGGEEGVMNEEDVVLRKIQAVGVIHPGPPANDTGRTCITPTKWGRLRVLVRVGRRLTPYIPISNRKPNKSLSSFTLPSTREKAVMDCTYDIVLLGATGFTGGITAAYMAKTLPRDVKWAIAGRSKGKLEAVAKDLSLEGTKGAVYALDLTSEDDIVKLIKTTRVVINTIGPYANSCGPAVIKACAENGTDYVDCAGEMPWLQDMIAKYDKTAITSGAKIITTCGWGAVPADLSTYLAVQHIRRTFDLPTREVLLSLDALKGGISGGSINTLCDLIATYSKARVAAATAPFALAPQARAAEAIRAQGVLPRMNALGVQHVDGLGTLMVSPQEAIEQAIVGRSWGFHDPTSGYGGSFFFSSRMRASNSFAAWFSRCIFLLLRGLLVFAPMRTLVGKRLFPAGTGPSASDRAGHFFKYRTVGVADTGDETARKRVEVSFDYSGSSYDFTGVALTEAAVLLLEGGTEAHGERRGGS